MIVCVESEGGGLTTAVRTQHNLKTLYVCATAMFLHKSFSDLLTFTPRYV